MPADLVVCPDAQHLAERAADWIVKLCRDAVESRGRCDIALAGGSTPEKAYRLLAATPRASRLDWPRIRFFFGDERFVAPDDERSNYAMARRTLFDLAPVPAENIYRFDTEAPTIQRCALDYDQLLTHLLGSPPVFDLVLLGMGDDGHTASLFPHAAALDVAGRWVADTPPGILPPPIDRVTLTLPVLRSARHCVFLVSGDKKAAALRDVLERRVPTHDRPSAAVAHRDGPTTFFVDEAAAGSLTKR